MTEGASPPSAPSKPLKRGNRAPDPSRILLVMYVVGTALILALSIASPVSTAKSISYSEFLEMVRTDEPEPFAEETARQIDSEIKQLVVDAHTRARPTFFVSGAVL